MWIALTVIVELLVPLPPTICSFKTTVMPAGVPGTTVLGAGLEESVTGTPPRITRVPLTIAVEPVVARAPQGPVIWAIDFALSAFNVRSGGVIAPTMETAT